MHTHRSNPPDADRLLSLAEVARKLGVSPVSIFRWGKSGLKQGPGRITLRLTRVGGRWRVAQSDLEAFLTRLNSDTDEASPPRARRADAHVDRELDRLLGPV
ncbi:helix-turn-helix domain-containing protein [Singulisphaera sp. PoT]|uniref:helix-turn-helix domain-containing protein n=1 Tax=Singulisphaera sp. PoT TaxID=3411797 RepID=UPI003BF48EAD